MKHSHYSTVEAGDQVDDDSSESMGQPLRSGVVRQGYRKCTLSFISVGIVQIDP